MRILDTIFDERISAHSVLLEMTFLEYQTLVSGAEDNLEIQRKVVHGFKPYEQLREDLRAGCLIPAPTLAIQGIDIPLAKEEAPFLEAIRTVDTKHVYIVDGLQRTNAIHQVIASFGEEAERQKFLARPLRVEVWPDISLKALTYRMILLNAGQKPMSLKHQLEVVSSALCDSLENKLPDIEIYRERDVDRRSGPRQYRFALIASAFQAFVQKAPHIDVRNDVIAELNQIDALESYSRSIGAEDKEDPSTSFVEYMRFLANFDSLACTVYPDKRTDDRGDEIPSAITLFSRETFQLGLAAAYAWCHEYKPAALQASTTRLFALLLSAQPRFDDPLELGRAEKIQTGFKRKDNVGEQTRGMIFSGFKEFFSSEGLTPFRVAWTMA